MAVGAGLVQMSPRTILTTASDLPESESDEAGFGRPRTMVSTEIFRLDVSMTEKTWVDHYYDALRFFYWEPQHLGRKKAEGAPLNSESLVVKRLRSMEVTLNHIINQFLSLAPSSFRNAMFEKALGQPMQGDFLLSGRDCAVKSPTWDTCQPDFFFSAADRSSTVYIEMKIESCSEVQQVFKYAALALSTEQAHGRNMQHFLIFLGKDSFAKVWPKSKRIGSVAELKAALLLELEKFSEQRFKGAGNLTLRFAEIISGLTVGFLNYEDFAELLSKEREAASESGSNVYRHLLNGMRDELQLRQLVRAETLNA